MKYNEILQQYENELSALNQKYEPLLLAAKWEVASQSTWEVIQNPKKEYQYCIWNNGLYLINDSRHSIHRRHSMPIERRRDVQIKEITLLLHRLTVEEDVVDGEYCIVSHDGYNIRITIHNNLFKLKYDDYGGHIEHTISLKNLCDILEKLLELCS